MADKLITICIKIQNLIGNKSEKPKNEITDMPRNLFICGTCPDKNAWKADCQILKGRMGRPRNWGPHNYHEEREASCLGLLCGPQ